MNWNDLEDGKEGPWKYDIGKQPKKKKINASNDYVF
jgi:hypothetical protein